MKPRKGLKTFTPCWTGLQCVKSWTSFGCDSTRSSMAAEVRLWTLSDSLALFVQMKHPFFALQERWFFRFTSLLIKVQPIWCEDPWSLERCRTDPRAIFWFFSHSSRVNEFGFISLPKETTVVDAEVGLLNKVQARLFNLFEIPCETVWKIGT